MKYQVLVSGEAIAKFALQSDAELFADTLRDVTGKTVTVETTKAIIYKAGA